MTDTEQRAAIDQGRVATAHFMAGAVFLALGSLLQVLAFASLRFADLFPVTFGRLEPMANLTLMIGFGVTSLVGGVYYVLPRLTGASLWRPAFAGFGLVGIAGLVLLGLAAIFFGFGDGRLPFGLPWWLHVPMLGALGLPALITVSTIRHRVEQNSYVTLWFVIGGVVWLPLLYLVQLAGALPGLSALGVEYSGLFFSAGFVTMVVFTIGTGFVYYTLVRELDVALASRQLALVGFWSLGFASVWWGTAQLLFGPGPDWLAGVGAALGLAFPIGALANAANVSLSLEGSWGQVPEEPGVSAGVYGLYLGVGVAVVAALAGFRSVAASISLTSYWEAVEYLAMAGVAPLLVASSAFSALPRLTGRRLFDARRARRFARLTLIGSVGTFITLAASGAISGYSWISGSNSAAYIDAGEGWAAGVGLNVDTLMLAAVVLSLVTLLGHLVYAGILFGTYTRGQATSQEVLVAREVGDE